MSISDVVVFQGREMPWDVEHVPRYEIACNGCIGELHDDVCNDLPEDCRTHRVRFVLAVA